MRILLLDNNDSFTYNLAELLRNNGKVSVKIETPEEVKMHEIGHFQAIIFSPGPGHPAEYPLMPALIQQFGASIPILGICLGMQTIALYFGASLYNLPGVVHGQPRPLQQVNHGHPIFRNLPAEITVGLYHSWAVDPTSLPSSIELLASSADGIPMAIAHRKHNICGVQFHPESIITPLGQQMINGWVDAVIGK